MRGSRRRRWVSNMYVGVGQSRVIMLCMICTWSQWSSVQSNKQHVEKDPIGSARSLSGLWKRFEHMIMKPSWSFELRPWLLTRTQSMYYRQGKTFLKLKRFVHPIKIFAFSERGFPQHHDMCLTCGPTFCFEIDSLIWKVGSYNLISRHQSS